MQGRPLGARPGPRSLILLELADVGQLSKAFGLESSDAALQILDESINEAAPPDTLVVRLHDNIYTLVVTADDEHEVLGIARDLLALLSAEPAAEADSDALQPASRHLEQAIDAKIGIAVHVDPGVSALEMFRRAKHALEHSKLFANGPVIYDPAFDVTFGRDLERVADELRLGDESGELVAWFQPQVESPGCAVTTFEALLRWRRADGDIAYPDEILPAARRLGLTEQLTFATLRLVAAQLAKWSASDVRLRVAVNVAPTELLGATFIRRLERTLLDIGMAPDALTIEIGAGDLEPELVQVQRRLLELADLGVRTCIDNYGGSSRATQLRDLPSNEVKIDRSVIRSFVSDPYNQTAVRAICGLGAALGRRVIAVGVEDVVTATALMRTGVDAMQGNHFAAPLPPDAVAEWLRGWRLFKHAISAP